MSSAALSLGQSHDVLRDLLHSVSQPLTTLHCALESSLTRDEVDHAEDVSLALEQTDRVIEAVRLMREYLDAEQGCSSPAGTVAPVALNSAIDNVLQQLSVLAAARGVHLFACGASKARIPVRDAWLQRAFLYLVGVLIDNEPPGSSIIVLLEDRAEQSVLSGHSLPFASLPQSPARPAPLPNSLQQVKVAIAQRALESAGASVEFFADHNPGFTVRVPRPASAHNELSA